MTDAMSLGRTTANDVAGHLPRAPGAQVVAVRTTPGVLPAERSATALRGLRALLANRKARIALMILVPILVLTSLLPFLPLQAPLQTNLRAMMKPQRVSLLPRCSLLRSAVTQSSASITICHKGMSPQSSTISACGLVSR